MKPLLLITLAIFPTLILTTTPVQDAQACGNSARYDREMIVKLKPSVMQADKHLQGHQWMAAITEAQDVYPELKQLGTSYQSTEDLELKRAAKIVAISTVRLKRHHAKGDTVAARQSSSAHISWANKALAHLSSKAPDDPELTAFYAEALALEPSTKAQALNTLSDLYKRDLLPHAYSYALLAHLHDDANDEAAFHVVRNRCLAISSQDKVLCNLRLKATSKPQPHPKSLAKSRAKSAPKPRSKALSKNSPDILSLD